jgi:hypothetical protein
MYYNGGALLAYLFESINPGPMPNPSKNASLSRTCVAVLEYLGTDSIKSKFPDKAKSSGVTKITVCLEDDICDVFLYISNAAMITTAAIRQNNFLSAIYNKILFTYFLWQTNFFALVKKYNFLKKNHLMQIFSLKENYINLGAKIVIAVMFYVQQ